MNSRAIFSLASVSYFIVYSIDNGKFGRIKVCAISNCDQFNKFTFGNGMEKVYFRVLLTLIQSNS